MPVYEVCVRRTEDTWYKVEAPNDEAAQWDYMEGEETFSKVKECTVVDVQLVG